ncbi:hypothetical protein D3C78_1167690 [compost metagenome]
MILTHSRLFSLITCPQCLQLQLTRKQLLFQLLSCGFSRLGCLLQLVSMYFTLILLNFQMTLALFFNRSNQSCSFFFSRRFKAFIFFLSLPLNLQQARYFQSQFTAFTCHHVEFIFKILNLNSLLRHMYCCKHRYARRIQSVV